MSAPTHEQKKHVAIMLGYLAGLHSEAKSLEAEGISEMDMVCCGLEDIFGILEPLLGEMGQVESMARSS